MSRRGVAGRTHLLGDQIVIFRCIVIRLPLCSCRVALLILVVLTGRYGQLFILLGNFEQLVAGLRLL